MRRYLVMAPSLLLVVGVLFGCSDARDSSIVKTGDAAKAAAAQNKILVRKNGEEQLLPAKKGPAPAKTPAQSQP